MPAVPQYTPPEAGRQLSAGMVADVQRQIQSLYTQEAPDGFVQDSSPFGNRLRNENRAPFLARITGDGMGSGSESGSGSVFYDRYDWEEVIPLSDKTFITKVGGRRGTSDLNPAVEANGKEDVPIDSIVLLHPATAHPAWYWFMCGCCEDASGSGNGIFTVTCADGNSSQFVIDGNNIRQLD